MNAVHAHLIINHFPIISVLFGSILLAIGIIWKNNTLRKTSLYIFAIAAVLSLVANKTGEEAEHIVEENASTLTHTLIHEHEESAETAVIVTIILGAMSIIALLLDKRGVINSNIIYLFVLLLGLSSFGIQFLAASSGGQISHEEIRSPVFEEPDTSYNL